MKANIAKDIASLAVPLDKLTRLPGNPRRGDVESVIRSYTRWGQLKPIVATGNAEDGGIVSAGNHQLDAVRQMGWDSIAVVWTDHSPSEAEAFALADNRTSELGTNDDSDLLAMLLRVTSADTDLLAAASYGTSDLIELLSAQPEPFLIEQDDGGDQSGDLNATYAIVVSCTDEMHQLELVERFMAEGLACRVLIS